MRTTKLLTMVAAVIAAGFLVVATTSNAAFAQTSPSTSASASSSISQSNTQTATCTAGTSNTGSCNQLAVNFNKGNAVSAAQAYTGGLDPATTTSDPSTSATASSSISQSNTQTATCTAGTSNSFSCNQKAFNINFGNAVSAAIASLGGQ
jgi:hypothetical protein